MAKAGLILILGLLVSCSMGPTYEQPKRRRPTRFGWQSLMEKRNPSRICRGGIFFRMKSYNRSSVLH